MHDLLIDNFAGGGGASIGIERAYGRPVDYAINHDPAAIEMHTANHPHTVHIAEDVWHVSPKKLCNGRKVALAWFSPDCTHFSKAKGSAPTRPRNRKIRGLAWVAVKWAVEVKPEIICLENVEEFRTWGPLKDGKPDPARKGQYYRKFIARLKALGYTVEDRDLIASHYGAPTSRKRFFLIARCDGEQIQWPTPTHCHPERSEGSLLASSMLPYRTAAECIDWSIPCPSIFLTAEEAKKIGCKRPLAESTLRRIARGIQKFIIDNPDPFIVPFVCHSEQSEEPLKQSAFMGYHYTGHDGYDMRDPLKTITQRDHHTLITANLIANTTNNPPYDVRDPLKTVTTGGHHAQVVAFLKKYHGLQKDESRCYDLTLPLNTIDTNPRFGLVTAFISKQRGTNIGTGMRDPVQTISAGGLHHAQVSAFLMRYNGQGIGQDLRDPMQTLMQKNKFGLVTIHGEKYQITDIGLRMLTPRELARAQGFPDDYILTGSKANQVARIGNSVPPQVVEAIIKANIHQPEPAQAEIQL